MLIVAAALSGLALLGALRDASAEVGRTGWQQLSVGSDHACASRASGRLYCWGGNFYGSLGNGDRGAGADRTLPVAVAGGATDWAVVSAGGHTCARKTSGRLFCWGDNFYGQLGIGDHRQPHPTPVEVSGGFTDWTDIAAGGTFTCALRSTGRLFCWGLDFNGQLGDGANADQLTPVEVAGGSTDWTAVSAGRENACALKTSGRLYCWGRNDHGQLGDGTTTDRSTPVEVSGAATDWAAVSTGARHTCAVKTSGRLFCWGGDARGRLGNGGAVTGDKPTPVEVAGGATDWAQVGAGTTDTCAVKTSGRMFCWGSDADGRLGNGGANVDRAAPVEVAGSSVGWRSVGVGAFHACARKTSGRLFCWGRDRQGQLGNGEPRHYSDVPVRVA